jgi:cytochrome c oxidase subunit II
MRSRAPVLAVVVALIIIYAGGSPFADSEQVIKVTTKKFEYSQKEITLKRGVPVILEFTSLDRRQGFNCPDLKSSADIRPGKVSTVRLVPEKVGIFPFHCDVLCGTGHEAMRGTIKVVEKGGPSTNRWKHPQFLRSLPLSGYPAS